ncbi:MAG: alginate lyase family protein [Ignavibacteriales bacterium]|nr:alginate lyase family protein [Ignavibacteriales bacterium]
MISKFSNLKRFSLYFDYLRRFDALQLIHLIKSRLLVELFPQKIRYNIKTSDRIDETSFQDFLLQFKLLFTTTDGHSVTIDEIVEGGLLKENYFTNLQDRFIKSMEKNEISESIWHTYDSTDIEIQNNFFRFYLFNEVADYINMTSSLRKQMILKWISLIKDQDKIALNSFNCSLRLFNWFKMISKFNPDNFTDQEWLQVKDSIFAHTLFINRNIEHHVPGNHVFIQHFMIWLVAMLFPKWVLSSDILKSSTNNLTAEAEKQFLKNGLHFELSTHYHVQILQFLLLWINASKRCNKSVSNSVKETARKGLNVLNHLLFSDDYIPLLGDNCFPFIHSSFKSDIKNINRLELSLFKNNQIIYKHQESKLITDIDQQYLVSEIKDSKLILDIGELGYPPNPGHGHSDLMSIVYFDKVPVLIDPGTKRYTNNPEDLQLKSSTSHNTISINDKDYATLWGFFRWSFLPQKPIYTFQCDDDENILDVKLEWLKILPGIIQKRKIFHNEFSVEIIDSIQGEKSANVISSYILHPDIKYKFFNNRIELSASGKIWDISIESNSDFVLSIQPFVIYTQYNMPAESNQIKISLNKARPPIILKFKITRIDQY